MKFLIKPVSLRYDGMIPTKVCAMCNHAKDIGEFRVMSTGFSGYCVECEKEYVKEYRQSAKYKEYKKEYDKSDKRKEYYKTDKRNEYLKKYRQSDKYKEYQKEYQKEYKKSGKFKESVKKYHKSDKYKQRLKEYQQSDKYKEYHKEYRKIPHNRLAKNLRLRVWHAIKNGSKSASTMKLLGCNIDFLMHWLEIQFKDGMTWDNYGEWHIDHIKPCASFDLTDPKHQKECFHYKNLQPLWASENLSKGAKI